MGRELYNKVSHQLDYPVTNSVKRISQSSGSWLAVVTMSSLPVAGLKPSQPQPLPCIAAIWALNLPFRPSRLPKSLSMASLRGPDGNSPPPDFAGAKFCQKREWLTWPTRRTTQLSSGQLSFQWSYIEGYLPPPLKLSAFWTAIAPLTSFFLIASCNCCSAVFKPFT